MKTCTKCGETKALDEFHADKSKRYGKCSQCKACQRKYNQTPKAKACQRKYEQTPEYKARRCEYQRAYSKTPKEKARGNANMRAKRHRRKARLASVENTLTREQIHAVFEAYGNKCVDCGTTDTLTIDHILPISKGGPNTAKNIRPLCLSCNSSKGARDADTFQRALVH